MLRINSRDVLVVPPFECAWLSLSDYGVEGGCCLSFEHKGDNDVTVIFKAVAGGKRWQPLARRAAGDGGDGGAGGGGGLAVEENYTVILGSHRNSCLKFEKNGETVAQVQGVPGSRVGSREFTPMWIDCRGGAITVGAGAPGASVAHRWVDPEPGELAQAIRHAGLSCWDRHVSYRNVRVLPPLDPEQLEAAVAAAAEAAAAAADDAADAASPEQRRQAASANGSPPRGSPCAACGAPGALKGAAEAAPPPPVRSCFDAASDAIIAALSPAFACRALQVAELLLPASDRAYRAAVEYLGARFEDCAARAGREMALLSAPTLADVLTEPLMSVPEYLIFEVVASWACYGQPPPSPAAGAGPSGPNFRNSSSSGGGGGSGGGDADRKSRRPSGSSRPGSSGGGGGPAGAEAEEGVPSAADAAGGEAYRPASELALVVPLVRFVLMGADDMAAVRSHPFVRRHPLVRQLIEGELAAAAEGAAAPGGGLTVFDRRRIVRPAGASDAHRQQQQQQPGVVGSPPGPHSPQQPHAHPHPHPHHQHHQPHLCTADGCRGGGPAGGFPSPRYHRRLAPSCAELMFVHDGDRNGAIAHIATDYGATAWVNPVLARRVEVRASSPASRFTDPKAIVGGTPPRTSFACPRWEGGAPSTWWLVDLGPSHRLLCNYYTMRHDSSSDFARHWVLQASNDLRHWVDLRRHIGDSSIRLPGQTASWPVSGPAAHLPFRAFRLLLAGPTLSATTPWNFCLAGVEFYGYFFRTPAPAPAGAAAGRGGAAAAVTPAAATPAAAGGPAAAAAAAAAGRAEGVRGG